MSEKLSNLSRLQSMWPWLLLYSQHSPFPKLPLILSFILAYDLKQLKVEQGYMLENKHSVKGALTEVRIGCGMTSEEAPLYLIPKEEGS